MISYDQAQTILAQVALQVPFSTEEISLSDANGRVLAEDLYAREMVPAFANSAMDGFALRSQDFLDFSSEKPLRLRVGGMIGAGDEIEQVQQSAQALEIMTGAPMPAGGFDAVVKIEDVEVTRDETGLASWIEIHRPVIQFENVRHAGEDFKIGDLILASGSQISTVHLLALAALGISRLKVRSRLSVGLISTGKELVDYCAQELNPGQIRNSTGLFLEQSLKALGLSIHNFGIIGDTIQEYKDALKRALDAGCKIIVSTGAVSMGQFDFVKPALLEMGAQIYFHKCAIRPGKPILFAQLNDKTESAYIFGVPGNPVSTAVGFQFFIKPFLQQAMGLPPDEVKEVELEADVKKPDGLATFYKAQSAGTAGRERVRSLPGQASFMVSPLLKTNAWLLLPEDGTVFQKGSQVKVVHI